MLFTITYCSNAVDLARAKIKDLKVCRKVCHREIFVDFKGINNCRFMCDWRIII